MASGKKVDVGAPVTATATAAAAVVKEAVEGGEMGGGGGDDCVERGKEREKEIEVKMSAASEDRVDDSLEQEKEEEEKRLRRQEAVTEDEEEDDECGWRDGEDEEDNFDTTVPSVEELLSDVSLPRLAGGYCSIGMINDEELPDNTTPHKPPIVGKHSRGGSIGSDPKKRKRVSQGNGKAKAPPKSAPVPKGKPVASTPKAASAVCAAPDAGRRAEAGDLSGLLVNGLFMSSVLVLEKNIMAKDAAIEKVCVH